MNIDRLASKFIEAVIENMSFDNKKFFIALLFLI